MFIEAKPGERLGGPQWQQVLLFTTRREALAAARSIRWPVYCAVRAESRFQTLWGLHTTGLGYLTTTGFHTLQQRCQPG
jgi:hypothetical protein